MAKARFCDLEGIQNWSSHADDLVLEEAEFSFVRALGNQLASLGNIGLPAHTYATRRPAGHGELAEQPTKGRLLDTRSHDDHWTKCRHLETAHNTVSSYDCTVR